MPVVTIQALPPDDPQKISQTLKAVVQALVAALNTANENVWAHFIPITALREGDKVFGGDEYRPVISVLANPRSEELINNGLNAIASAVSSGLGLKKIISGFIGWTYLLAGFIMIAGLIKYVYFS